uniref:Uncharacterized protein n=1 Tax=Solanum lycopersicum TaxID=4081 RepID=A0A3Q7EY58_SOLLC
MAMATTTSSSQANCGQQDPPATMQRHLFCLLFSFTLSLPILLLIFSSPFCRDNSTRRLHPRADETPATTKRGFQA